MTVIVVVQKNDMATIAADTQINEGSTILPGELISSPRKIQYIADTHIGIVGSMAHHRVFHSITKRHADKLNFTNAEQIFETLRTLQDILKNDYYTLAHEDDDDQPYASNQLTGLLCNKTGIYGFQSYREVTQFKKFWATGSGMNFALGALEASYDMLEESEDIARTAIQAACRYSRSCGLPLQVHTVTLNLAK